VAQAWNVEYDDYPLSFTVHPNSLPPPFLVGQFPLPFSWRNLSLLCRASRDRREGQNLEYRNNLFFGGGWDSWVPAELLHGYCAAVRTSPTKGACGQGPTCPDKLHYEGNLIGLWNNNSALLFEGDYNSSTEYDFEFVFRRNLYFATSPTLNLADPSVKMFGGVSYRMSHKDNEQLAWHEWQASGQDLAGAVLPFTQVRGGALGGNGGGIFADPDWEYTFNVTVLDSVAEKGWQQIDTSSCGIQPLL